MRSAGIARMFPATSNLRLAYSENLDSNSLRVNPGRVMQIALRPIFQERKETIRTREPAAGATSRDVKIGPCSGSPVLPDP